MSAHPEIAKSSPPRDSAMGLPVDAGALVLFLRMAGYIQASVSQTGHGGIC